LGKAAQLFLFIGALGKKIDVGFALDELPCQLRLSYSSLAPQYDELGFGLVPFLFEKGYLYFPVDEHDHILCFIYL
jgi:hypothetical protein